MTIKELKEIVFNLPDNTIVLMQQDDINEVEMVNIQLHSDGRKFLILTALE